MNKRRRRISINLSNRWLYTLIAVGIILIIGVGVYALGAIPNPGHSISQLQTCNSNGQTLVMSNGAWTCGAGSSNCQTVISGCLVLGNDLSRWSQAGCTSGMVIAIHSSIYSGQQHTDISCCQLYTTCG